MKNKLFVLIVLFMVVVGLTMGSVSAKSTTKKYKDWCHGGDIKHKATWTKKYDSKAYVGTVYKNGYKYKKYVKLYVFTCICKKTKYHKPWLEATGDKYYSYETYSSGSPEKYVYKKIGKRKKKSSKSYVASINSNKFHYSSCRSAKRIKSYNKIKFSSRSDAINQGYSPCKVCHP